MGLRDLAPPRNLSLDETSIWRGKIIENPKANESISPTKCEENNCQNTQKSAKNKKPLKSHRKNENYVEKTYDSTKDIHAALLPVS